MHTLTSLGVPCACLCVLGVMVHMFAWTSVSVCAFVSMRWTLLQWTSTCGGVPNLLLLICSCQRTGLSSEGW